jgi:(p)ppGpp synthase/HD superfamily hydrolase
MIYAAQLHAAQRRKGTDIPYVAHLLAVTALVLENGGDEDQAIGALLHDAAEDQGGLETLQEIRRRFGERVADIVHACSDSFEFPKPPWKKRKEDYLAHLETTGDDVLLVSMADKVHNARSILADLRQYGASTWRRFSGGRDGSLWYYRSLLNIFQRRSASILVRELEELIDELGKW